MGARAVETCDVCGGRDLELVLDLGTSPPTCNMHPVGKRPVSEEHHPLELLRCSTCGFVCLSVVVDREQVFPQDYPYSSGNSEALHRNFEDLASRCEVGPDDLVVDIGANDGTLLSKFDCRTVGVEPTRQILKGDTAAYHDFFSDTLAAWIRMQHGPAKVITACNVLAHVDDLDDVMRGIDTLLAPDGVLIAENHDLASVVAGQWDTVYHEHLRYFDPHSFANLLWRYGFGGAWKPISTHGGSFRYIASRGGVNSATSRRYDFKRLAAWADNNRWDLRERCLSFPLVGIGATARATTIINYCGLDVEDVEFVCEVSGSDKIGRYIPGTRIPVVDESELGNRDAILFSHHLRDVIEPNLRARGYTGTLYEPL